MVVIDAAHDAGAIVDAVGDRRVVAVVCTHGHNDHVTVAAELASDSMPRCCLHPDDRCCGT